MARDAGEYTGEYAGKNEGNNAGQERRRTGPVGTALGQPWWGRRWENIMLGQLPGGAGAPTPTHSCGSVSVTSRR